MQQIVIGHLTIDNIFFETKKKNRFYMPGGAAMYSACASSMWGGDVAVVSKMGRDYVLYEVLKKGKYMNIDTSNIELVDDPSIILDIKYDKDGEHTFIPLRGIGTYIDMAPNVEDVKNALLEKDMVCHVAPIPIRRQISIVNAIRENKDAHRIITLDPDILDISVQNMMLWKKLLESIDVLILSMAEFVKFEQILNQNEIINMYRRMNKVQNYFGVSNIILKAGSEGAYLLKKDGGKYHIASLASEYVDYTGAGDAFAGGVGYALAQKYRLEKGLLYGTVASSIAMKEFGFMHMLSVSNKTLNNMLNTFEGTIREES